MAREPRAVRKAREELNSAHQTQNDSNANSGDMRRFLMNTKQSHTGVRFDNSTQGSTAKNVRRAEKKLGEAVRSAAIKEAKKEAKKQARKAR